MIDSKDDTEATKIEDEDNKEKDSGYISDTCELIAETIHDGVGKQHQETPNTLYDEQINQNTNVKDNIEADVHKEATDTKNLQVISEAVAEYHTKGITGETKDTRNGNKLVDDVPGKTVVPLTTLEDSDADRVHEEGSVKGFALSEINGSIKYQIEEEDKKSNGEASGSNLGRLAESTVLEEKLTNSETSTSSIKQDVAEKAHKLDYEENSESIIMYGDNGEEAPKEEKTSDRIIEEPSSTAIGVETSSEAVNKGQILVEEGATKNDESLSDVSEMVKGTFQGKEENSKVEETAPESAVIDHSDEANEITDDIKNKTSYEENIKGDEINDLPIIGALTDEAEPVNLHGGLRKSSTKADSMTDMISNQEAESDLTSIKHNLEAQIETEPTKIEISDDDNTKGEKINDLPIIGALNDEAESVNLHGGLIESSTKEDNMKDMISNQEASDLASIEYDFEAKIEATPAKIEISDDDNTKGDEINDLHIIGALTDEAESANFHGALIESSTKVDNMTHKISNQEAESDLTSMEHELEAKIETAPAKIEIYDDDVQNCRIVSQIKENKDLYPKDDVNVGKNIQSSPFIPAQVDETREAEGEHKKILHKEQIYKYIIEENNIAFDVTEEEFKTKKLERYSLVLEEQSSKEIIGKEVTEKDITEDTPSVSQDFVAEKITETASLMEEDKLNHDEREVTKSIGETILEEAKSTDGAASKSTIQLQAEKGNKLNILDELDSKENLVNPQPQKNQEDTTLKEELLNGDGIPSNILHEDSAEVVGVESPRSIDEEVKYSNLVSKNFETTCEESSKVDDEKNHNPTADALNTKEASIEKEIETDTSGTAFEVHLSELEENDVNKLNKVSELITEGKLDSFEPQSNKKEMQMEEETLNACHTIPSNMVYKEFTLTVGVESPREQILDEEETFRSIDREVKNSNLVYQENFETNAEKWTNEVSDERLCSPTFHALSAEEASTYEDIKKHTFVIVSNRNFHDAVEDKEISEKDIPGTDKGLQDADISSETMEDGKKQDEKSEIQPQHIVPETISINWSDKKERVDGKNISEGESEKDKLENMEPRHILNVVSEEIQTVTANIDRNSVEINSFVREKMLEKEIAELNTVNNNDEKHFACEEGAGPQKEIFNASEHAEGADATNENANNIVHNELAEDITIIEAAGYNLQIDRKEPKIGGKSEERFECEENPEKNGKLKNDIQKKAKNIELEGPFSTVQNNIELEEPPSIVSHNIKTDNSSKSTEGLIAEVNGIEAPVTCDRYEMRHQESQKDEAETEKEKEPDTKCESSTSHAANTSPNNEVNDVQCLPSEQNSVMDLNNIETGPLMDDGDRKKNLDAIFTTTSEKKITEVGRKLDEVSDTVPREFAEEASTNKAIDSEYKKKKKSDAEDQTQVNSSNLSYPSSLMAVDGYVKDEHIPEQEVISTSSQAKQVKETNNWESNAEPPNKLMDTSDLVKAQKNHDFEQTMEKTVVKGDESPLSNRCDSYPTLPVAEDVKNEVSGLLCEVSTDVYTYDTKNMTSRKQSGPHDKVEIEQLDNLHLEQDEKIHAAHKNGESLSKDFDVSNASKVHQEYTLLKEGSKGGNIVLQYHENIDKATFKEKAPLISESVGNTESSLQIDKTTESSQYNQNKKSLEFSNTEILLDIKSEVEKNSEENQDGNSKSPVKNMNINSVEESKIGRVDEKSLEDRKEEKKAKVATDTLLKDEKADEGKEEKEEEDENPEEKHVIEETDTQQEEDISDKEKEEKEEGDEHKVEDNNVAVIEKGRDEESKPTHRKSHNILSGVGSKVKHSLSKIKKAIIGKSSHSKAASPKQQ